MSEAVRGVGDRSLWSPSEDVYTSYRELVYVVASASGSDRFWQGSHNCWMLG